MYVVALPKRSTVTITARRVLSCRRNHSIGIYRIFVKIVLQIYSSKGVRDHLTIADHRYYILAIRYYYALGGTIKCQSYR